MNAAVLILELNTTQNENCDVLHRGFILKLKVRVKVPLNYKNDHKLSKARCLKHGNFRPAFLSCKSIQRLNQVSLTI